MASCQSWKLRRFARYTQSADKTKIPWKLLLLAFLSQRAMTCHLSAVVLPYPLPLLECTPPEPPHPSTTTTTTSTTKMLPGGGGCGLRDLSSLSDLYASQELLRKIYEGNQKGSQVILTILDSGYLLVMQGQESLDTVHLSSSGDSIKVHKKFDHLLFRFTFEGESRITRMQFQAKNKEEASKQCANALKKVMEYLPGTCLENTPQPPGQTHIETQVTQHENNVRREHQPVPDLLPMKKLAQYFLGDAALTLPEVYHHTDVTHDDFAPILRVFLLDPSFHGFVEKVEGELKTLLQE